MVAYLWILKTHDQIQILIVAELTSSWHISRDLYMVSSIGYSSTAQFGYENEVGMVVSCNETGILRVWCENPLSKRTGQVCELNQNFVASNIPKNK